MSIFTRKKKKEEGFTLIELIIVVAIIGFLMAIAIPRYATSRLVAAQSATKANLHQLANALEVYVTENTPKGYPNDAAQAATALQAYLPKAPKTPGGAYYMYIATGATQGTPNSATTFIIWDPSTPTTNEGTGVYQVGPGGVITVGPTPTGGGELNW